jgi:ABC-type nitrate/sulfonate/bicarbonate transport system permease component
MNKSEMLRYVNLPLALSFIIQGLTGAIIALGLKLPIQELLFEVHEYNGLLLVLLGLFHIYLNWGWIRATFFPAKKKNVPTV